MITVYFINNHKNNLAHFILLRYNFFHSAPLNNTNFNFKKLRECIYGRFILILIMIDWVFGMMTIKLEIAKENRRRKTKSLQFCAFSQTNRNIILN